MIPDVGIADPRRNTDDPSRSGQHRRLADAKTAACGQHATGAIVLLIENVDIRIVDNAVANRAIEPNDAIGFVAQPCRDPMRERLNRGGVAIDKATRCEQFLHGHRQCGTRKSD